MDVRGPGPGNNLNATYRLEHSGEAIPREHLKQTESDDHARAPEVGKLLLELREIPEIRPEVVAAAKQRVSDGTYLSREAAEQVSAAILGSHE